MKKFLVFAAFALIFAVSCSNTSSKHSEITDNDSQTGDNDTETPDGGDADTPENPEIDTDDTDIPDEENDDTKPDHDVVIVEGLDYESGFIYLEENEYFLNNRNDKSGRAKMWYNFQPADENPEEKPLFVFYNGGPGSASAIVFLYNTAKKTADQAFSGEGVADNAFNWNQIGNLLYIDARQTGFSFGIVDDPADESVRSAYFSTSNFNVFTDAADFIRVILRFLESHPKIKSNPVIPSGESYGGTRTTALINILQNVADYAENNRVFYDEALFKEIARHFHEIDPTITGMPSKEDVVKQFGRQIMIQPLVMGMKQMDAAGELLERSDSPVYIIEQETGIKFSKCSSSNCYKYNNATNYVENADRDVYSYRRPHNWLFDYTDVATAKMLQMPMFEELIMNDPTKINELYAESRAAEGAFRYSEENNRYTKNLIWSDRFEGLPEIEKTIIKARIKQRQAHPLSNGNLEDFFGILPDYDDYFVDLSYFINATFYYASVSPYNDVNGEMFLENIRNSKTFITQAEEDIVIYAKGIPEAAKSFSSVSSVDTEDNSFTVHFKDGESATVTFPFYPESSHSVAVNQPEKFLNDVKNWLNK